MEILEATSAKDRAPDTALERGCAESQPQHRFLKATARTIECPGLFPLLRLALRAQPRSFPQVSGAVSRCGPKDPDLRSAEHCSARNISES
jgi:hypothetical protein